MEEPALDRDEAVPAEYVVGHVQEALGSDERVGEWNLDVAVDGSTVTVSGVVATATRKSGVASVTTEALATLGGGYEVVDSTHVMAAQAPRGEEELA